MFELAFTVIGVFVAINAIVFGAFFALAGLFFALGVTLYAFEALFGGLRRSAYMLWLTPGWLWRIAWGMPPRLSLSYRAGRRFARWRRERRARHLI